MPIFRTGLWNSLRLSSYIFFIAFSDSFVCLIVSRYYNMYLYMTHYARREENCRVAIIKYNLLLGWHVLRRVNDR